MSSKIRKFDRILLKLSGEALTGSADFGIDPKVLDRMALEIGQLVEIGVQVGVVIGGGNLFRGLLYMLQVWKELQATIWACLQL